MATNDRDFLFLHNEAMLDGGTCQQEHVRQSNSDETPTIRRHRESEAIQLRRSLPVAMTAVSGILDRSGRNDVETYELILAT